MTEYLKALCALGDSRRFIQKMPESVRRQLGYTLFQVQSGNSPRGLQELKGFSVAVQEIRLRHDKESYRAIFTVALGNTVLTTRVP